MEDLKFMSNTNSIEFGIELDNDKELKVSIETEQEDIDFWINKNQILALIEHLAKVIN